MKRLQTQHKSPLRRLMLALVGLIAATGMLVAAQGASANPTAAPEIVSTPSNPNTTQATVTFDFTTGVGETSSAETFTFTCRQFPTASPPSPAAGWEGCGNTQYPETTIKSFSPENGAQTFQVAASENNGAPFASLGPIASYEWTQNIPAPGAAPSFTSTPEDPQTGMSMTPFEFEPGEGDEDLVLGVECRVDSSIESSWQPCSSNGVEGTQYENGAHKLEARAFNHVGKGPIAEFTWTKDVPNPNVAMPLDDVSSVQWGPRGYEEPGNVGGRTINSAGDINGDGRDDLVARSANANVFVLFTPEHGIGIPNEDMSPKLGYKIVTDNVDFGDGPYTNTGIGDQNGDGVPDLLLTNSDADASNMMVYVLYGISDPASSLPNCPGSYVKLKCQDITELSPSEGYQLTDGKFSEEFFGWGAASGDANVMSAGDVNGDDIDDIMIGAPNATDGNTIAGRVWIVLGGREAPQDGQPVNVFDLPASEAIQIKGPPFDSGAQFGGLANALGDLDGDGLDDIVISGAALKNAGVEGQIAYVFYGKSLVESPISAGDFGPSFGFRIATPLFSSTEFAKAGDLNGDGRPDLFVGGPGGGLTDDNALAVVFTPATPPEGTIFPSVLESSQGYTFDKGLFPADLGGVPSIANGLVNIGDVNGDGIPDQAIGAPSTVVDGLEDTGATYVTFGRSSGPGIDPETELSIPVSLGTSIEPDSAIALLGDHPVRSQAFGRSGDQVIPAGDQDDDGLDDFWVTDIRSTELVLSKNLLAQFKANEASNLNGTGATLSGTVSNTAGEGEAWFEYGTTDEYGEETAGQAVDGPSSVEADLTGLTANTVYHYRMVVKNGKGLTKYGEDQTFNSGDVIPDPDPVETCDLDPSGPGCANYCQANPTAMGCPDFDWCAANPGKCNNGGTKKTNAKLSLIASPKSLKVKRGKKGSVSAIVFNSGGKTAHGVKVCVKAPKKLVKVKKCQTIGGLGAGKTKTKQFKVKVSKKAKKGKKITLKFTASSKNAGKKTATVKVKVG
jgi:hypothetical protein